MTDTAKQKPSPGPWLVGCGYGNHGVRIVGGDGSYAVCNVAHVEKDIKDKEGRVIGTERIERAWSDVSIIMQAGTVYHETGLTPRQLVEQRNELLSALRMYIKAGFGNSTDHYAQADAANAARAIIAKVEAKS